MHKYILVAGVAACLSASCTMMPSVQQASSAAQDTSDRRIDEEVLIPGAIGVGLGLYSLLRGKKKIVIRDREKRDFIPRSLIVIMHSGQGDPHAVISASKLLDVQLDHLDEVDLMMIVGNLPEEIDLDAEIARIEKLDNVAWIQREGIFELKGQFAPELALVQDHSATRFDASLAAYSSGPISGAAVSTGFDDVKIAMVDGVVDLGHEALKGSWIRQQRYVSSNDTSIHGTAIASVIVGKGDVQGVAPTQRLSSFAAFAQGDGNRPGLSSTRLLARALNAAAKIRPDILNMSFGGPNDRVLQTLVSAMDSQGTCIFAATGNGGAKARPPFPANMAEVNGITALDRKLRAYKYATPGGHVSAAALGVKRLTAVPGGYRIASGTSFASAYAAGQASLLSTCGGGRNPAAMRQHIAHSSVDLGKPGRDDTYGYGQFR